MKKFVLLTIAVFLYATFSQAAIVQRDISWYGPNDYSLIGTFEYDDTTVGSYVDVPHLTFFHIDGFHGATLLGSFTATTIFHGNILEYFEYDPINETFISAGINYWNNTGSGIGFDGNYLFGDNHREILTLDGVEILGSSIPFGPSGFGGSPSTVPLPAALPLYASAIAIFGLLAWRRKRTKFPTPSLSDTTI